MYNICYVDFETRSEVDIKEVGAYNYARHPSTDIICVAYTLNNGSIKLWHPYDKKKNRINPFSKKGAYKMCMPKSLIHAWREGFTFEAHNKGFEQYIWNFVMQKKYGWPPVTFTECSAAKAAALALPRSLEQLCLALKLPKQKDMTGKRTMLKLTKPRRPTKSDPDSKWHESVSDLNKVFSYCKDDVGCERLASNSMPELIPQEKKLYELDQKINQRGIQIDMKSLDNALYILNELQAEQTQELIGITGGLVQSASEIANMSEFIQEQHIYMPNLQAGTIEETLKNKLPDNVRRVLEIRQSLSQSSTKKLQAMKNRMDEKGIVREILLFCGASTGRWAGSGIQVQNFPRGEIKDQDTLFEAINSRDLSFFKTMYPDPMGALASSLRGMIIPHEGNIFRSFDYNAIEARVAFWLTGCKTGLEGFRKGIDNYKNLAVDIFEKGLDTISQDERFVGKQAFLGCIAKDTMVLTEKGFIKIQHLKNEKVWNGEKWVKHEGLLIQGPKSVIKLKTLGCIELTSDHWVLTKQGWQTAGEIGIKGDICPQKLEASIGGQELYLKSLKEALRGVSKFAAYVELKKKLELINFGEVSSYFAKNVQALIVGNLVGIQTEMLTSYLIQNLEHVGELVTTILKKDVTEVIQKTSRGIKVAVLKTNSHPLESFWNTLLHCAGLINLDSPWTELIMMDTMSLETYESLAKKLTTEIGQIKETYDIKNVDEGNRYNIWGTLVHNCTYQMGPPKFQKTCANLGQPVSDEVAAKAVRIYREKFKEVSGSWRELQNAGLHCVGSGKSVEICKVKFEMPCSKYLTITLPSGRKLYYWYPRIQEVETEWGMRPTVYFSYVDSQTKKWTEGGIYGGLWLENITQAVSRDIMASAMLAQSRFDYFWNKRFISFTVHDEIVFEDNLNFGSLKELQKDLLCLPKWAEGLPMKVEGWEEFRYAKN